MRGDLHTLKRVCSYASVVMMAAEAVFAVLAVAMIALGISSFYSDDVRDMFTTLIRSGDSDLSVISGAIEMTVLFVAMFITVKVIHDIMSSIMKEHSPFMEGNEKGFKTVSITYLIVAVPLTAFEYLNREDAILSVCILLVCILISVVMYCLTIIFRYGNILQDESDRTL